MERSPSRKPRGEAIEAIDTAVLDEILSPTKKRTARKGAGLLEQIKESPEKRQHVAIDPPKFETATFHIKGVAPLVINAFSQKTITKIKATQEAGQQARSKRTRVPKDFEAVYRDSLHVAGRSGSDRGGWHGFNANAIRSAMIDCCRLVGYKMTIAKMSVFVEADGYDAREGTPLVRINGEPHSHIGPVRNPNTGTIDMAARGMFDPGWTASLRITWDADQFSASDIAHLLVRAGRQNGIGEGRVNSKNSYGVGWGVFELVEKAGSKTPAKPKK